MIRSPMPLPYNSQKTRFTTNSAHVLCATSGAMSDYMPLIQSGSAPTGKIRTFTPPVSDFIVKPRAGARND